MYERILVPLDGSKLAEHVLPYVRALAQAHKLPVTVLQAYASIPPEVVAAVEPGPAPAPGPQGQAAAERRSFLAQVSAERKQMAEEYVNSVAERLRMEKIAAKAVVQDAPPDEAIAAEAGIGDGTLIVMSTHGRSGVARLVVGSVMDKVLRSTSSPLFVVRPREGEPPSQGAAIRNIVLPLDGSPVAEQVLPYAAALATALRATVRPAWVIPPFPAYYGGYMGDASGALHDLVEETEKAAREYLGRIRARLMREGVAKVYESVLFGNPAESIIDMARTMPYSLVAMTTHGRSGVGRFVMGSVADQVVRHSGAPVLLVRAKGEKQG